MLGYSRVKDAAVEVQLRSHASRLIIRRSGLEPGLTYQPGSSPDLHDTDRHIRLNLVAKTVATERQDAGSGGTRM